MHRQTRLDIYLRNTRFAKARPFIRPGDVVLDIGSEEGAQFETLRGIIKYGVGLDPILSQERRTDLYTLYPGAFPSALPDGERYDVITMLAVLEHIPPAEQASLGRLCSERLEPGGRVIITVPSPHVDRVLLVLRALRLVEATTLHQHYGFDVGATERLFGGPSFRTVVKRRFQLGLNNLFVFERC